MNNSVWKTVDSSAWESPSKAGTVPYRLCSKDQAAPMRQKSAQSRKSQLKVLKEIRKFIF